jgi:predicted RND superfamily exporter protein
MIEKIQAAAREVIESNPETSPPSISLTGHMIVVQGSQEILLSDLFRSFLAAFAIIAVVMVVFLRSLTGGLVAMIPNLVPTAFLFGVMGWLRLPLDIGSVMTASVALGIAVDDNVHLLSRFRNFRAGGHPHRQAAELALNQCGMAMLQTTIVCSTSLLIYGLSDFIPTRRFAFFMLGLLSVAWLGVSLLLPAIMSSGLGRFLGKGNRIKDSLANSEIDSADNSTGTDTGPPAKPSHG